MSTLYLVLKGEWFDKIERGEKTHEYRVAKPYWATRIHNLLNSNDDDLFIIFIRGYHKGAPRLEAEITNIGMIMDGRETDLNVDTAVYDIEFRNVRRIT